MLKSHMMPIFCITVILFSSACSNINKDESANQSEADSDLLITEDSSLISQNDYQTRAVLVRNNIVYVGVGNSVSILKFANPTYYDVIGMIGNLAGDVNDIESSENTLFIAEKGCVHIVDVTDPAIIQETSTYQTDGKIDDILVLKNNLYIANGDLGIQIVDISNLTEPEKVMEYDTLGNAKGIEVVGDYLYIADGEAGIRVLDISILSTPKEIGHFDTPGSSSGISINENRLYVADGEAGLRILDISDPSSINEIGTYDTMGDTQNVTVNGNYVFLADGSNGLSVLDVSNPDTPQLEGIFNTNGDTVDVQVSRGVAYIAASQNGLRVVDLIEQKIPYDINTNSYEYYDFTRFGIKKSPQVMEISGNYIYLIGTMKEKNDGNYYTKYINGLYILDISDLKAIKEVGKLSSDEFQFVTDIFISMNYLFILDYNTGLHIIDVSDPILPVEISSIKNLQSARSIFVKDGYAYVVGYALGLRIYDVSNPLNITKVNFDVMDFYGLSVQIKDNFAYVASGDDGLKIIDISDLKLPREINGFDTPGTANGLFIKDNLVFIADGKNGLQIIDISDVMNPKRIGFFENLNDSCDVYISGNYAYVANAENGLSVIDISIPEMLIEVNRLYDPDFKIVKVNIANNYLFYFPINPAIEFSIFFYDVSTQKSAKDIGFYLEKRTSNYIWPEKVNIYEKINTSFEDISISSKYAFAKFGKGDLILDISNISQPLEISSLPYAGKVDVSDNYAFVANENEGLIIFDISDIKNPIEIGSLKIPGSAYDVSINGNYAYVCAWEGGLRIIDISIPENPIEIGSYSDDGQVHEVIIKDSIAYLADGLGGFIILDVADPTNPFLIRKFIHEGQAQGVDLNGNYAYVAWNSGFQIVDITNSHDPIQLSFSEQESIYRPYIFQDVVVQDNFAILTTLWGWSLGSPSFFNVFNISDPVNPEKVTIWSNANMVSETIFVNTIEIIKPYILIPADGAIKIYRISGFISTPEYLQEFSSFERPIE